MPNFTPREVVSELDRYIVGQRAAKRAAAIALRHRGRRLHVPPDLLLPRPERRIHAVGSEPERKAAVAAADDSATREKLRRMLREGKLDDRTVDVEVTKPVSPMIEVMTPQGMEEVESGLKEMLSN